jgi:AcrR family transcriptional regulator
MNRSAEEIRRPGIRAMRQSETRRRVAEAAAAVFSEAGYEGATMRAIAARAGVATGTLFLYAPEKRSLLFMILNNAGDRATEEELAQTSAGLPLLERIVQLFALRYTYLGHDKRLSLDALRQLTFLTDEEDHESESARYVARLFAVRRRITELVAEHKSAGAVSSHIDPEDVAAIAMAVYASEVRTWLVRPQASVADGMTVLQRRIAIALQGIAPTTVTDVKEPS